MEIREELARRIFETAIRQHQCGELLECLFDGGSVTVDPNGKLIMLTADALNAMGGN